jgi:hypothetical protein
MNKYLAKLSLTRGEGFHRGEVGTLVENRLQALKFEEIKVPIPVVLDCNGWYEYNLEVTITTEKSIEEVRSQLRNCDITFTVRSLEPSKSPITLIRYYFQKYGVHFINTRSIDYADGTQVKEALTTNSNWVKYQYAPDSVNNKKFYTQEDIERSVV